MIENPVPAAMAVVTKALREEPDYRYSWQANIAMSMYDAFKAAGYDFPELHKICNFGAVRFLDLMTMKLGMDDDAATRGEGG